MQNIGIVAGSKIVVVNLSGNNAILLVKSHRVAVSREILGQIFVNKKTASSESWTSLDQLKAGETGIVVAIHGQGAVKRRLMDMGLTRNVKIVIRKLAPLGDPIELTVRGYELTLRKSEAELILIQREGKRMNIALVGNPNSGKTSLFNLLTGSNQYVGNWPGVTVEKKKDR